MFGMPQASGPPAVMVAAADFSGAGAAPNNGAAGGMAMQQAGGYPHQVNLYAVQQGMGAFTLDAWGNPAHAGAAGMQPAAPDPYAAFGNPAFAAAAANQAAMAAAGGGYLLSPQHGAAAAMAAVAAAAAGSPTSSVSLQVGAWSKRTLGAPRGPRDAEASEQQRAPARHAGWDGTQGARRRRAPGRARGRGRARARIGGAARRGVTGARGDGALTSLAAPRGRPHPLTSAVHHSHPKQPTTASFERLDH